MTPEANIKAVISADDRASSTLRRFGRNADKSLGRTGKAAKGAGIALTALGAIATGGMGLAAKAAIDFESTFANVRKTVDASEREFELLENNLRDLSRVIPTPVGELNNLAAIAGQLGIEGVDNITNFTETIAKLGDTTDIAGEQAALSISRLMNIMGTAQKDVDRMGATIVDLGNNFAARESEIVEISTSLASFGQRVGLTESQVLAFGATIAASGGKVQAAGTAFQKVAGTMKTAVITGNENLERFADVAGMTAQEFKEGFQEDAAGAITAFIKGLNRINEEGEALEPVLDGLGLSQERLIREFSKVAANSDQLTEALDRGKKAWQENTALTAEARKRYGTTRSALQILKNVINDVAVEFGQTLLPAIRETANNLLKNMPKVVKVIKSVLKGFLAFSKALQDLGVQVADFSIRYLKMIDAISITKSYDDTIQSLETMRDQMKNSSSMVDGMKESIDEIDPSMFKLGDRTREVSRNLGNMTRKLLNSSDKTDKQRKMTDTLTDKLKGLRSAQNKYNRVLKREGPVSEAARKAKQKLSEKQNTLRSALQEAGVDLDRAAGKTANLSGNERSAARNMQNLISKARNSNRPIRTFIQGVQSAAGNTGTLASRLRDAWGWARNLLSKLSDVPVIGRGASMVNDFLSQIQGRQHGGMAGGPTVVGERGPELVNLPSGSQVTPNNQMSTTNNNTVNLNVNVGMFAGSPMERREIAETLMEDLKDVARKNNTTPMEMLGG